MEILSTIIREEIQKIFLSEAKRPVSKEIADAFKKFIQQKKERENNDSTSSEKKHKKNIKRRKLSHGQSQVYDFDDWKRDNVELDKNFATSITDKINMDTLDLAAAARKVFPSHTPEGAQSQLRKIILGERPMTYKVARKLSKMISQGTIPVK